MLRAEVSGAAAIRFTGKDDAACLTQHSFDSGLDVTFGALGGKGLLELGIDGVAEGETGEGYAAEVGVTSGDSQRWRGASCGTTRSREAGAARSHSRACPRGASP